MATNTLKALDLLVGLVGRMESERLGIPHTCAVRPDIYDAAFEILQDAAWSEKSVPSHALDLIESLLCVHPLDVPRQAILIRHEILCPRYEA